MTSVKKLNLTLITKPQKVTRTTLDTILVTPPLVGSWKSPPFQRPLTVNNRVREIAEQIKETEVIPGVLTLGVLGRDTYLLDGQHRRQAFLISEIKEGYADVRIHHFDDFGDMGAEFVKLNTAITRLKPDDILRGFEAGNANIRKIREQCPFIGYDHIRRGDNAPIVSMSAALRSWFSSAGDNPSSRALTAMEFVQTLTEEDTSVMISFFRLAFEAWGRDQTHHRLWGGLNLVLCAWIYRRTVVTQYSLKTPKLTRDLFKKCLMSVSADAGFYDWLLGRTVSERDRSPAYARLKAIFVKRLSEELNKKVMFPQPAWAVN